MELLHTCSCLECEDLHRHNKEIYEIINKIINFNNYKCALICKYQDIAHKHIQQEIKECQLSDIFDFLGSRDIKNGIDLLTDKQYLVFLLYGQTYHINDNKNVFIKTEAIKVIPYNSNCDFINVIPLLQNNSPTIIKANWNTQI